MNHLFHATPLKRTAAKGGQMPTLARHRFTPPHAGSTFNKGVLRRWSSPETMLVVTDLMDEESIQFHAIQQARRNGAKVLLVQVDRRDSSTRSIYAAGDPAERMARYLRWSGVACEPIVVRSVQAKQIPSIVSSSCAHRVLVSAPVDQSDTLVQELIDRVEIPVCVVPRTLSLASRYQRPARRITLVLSLHAKNEIPIGFASRFANENHAQLTIMHVFPTAARNGLKNEHLVSSFVSKLPSTVLREAELICPVEILIREGDPGNEVLKYDSRCNQDFVILAPPRNAGPFDFGIDAVGMVIQQAQCPVLVLTDPSSVRDQPRAKS